MTFASIIREQVRALVMSEANRVNPKYARNKKRIQQ